MKRLTALYMILFMIVCGGCEDDKPLQKVELKETAKNADVIFMRFDADLFNSDFSNPDFACQQLYQKYGSFFCGFVENDLQLANCQSDSLGKLLKPFVMNPDIIETHKEILSYFNTEKTDALNNQLTECLRRWNHYFPERLIPTVIYYQSAWNNNIAPNDSSLGISLDCYLGKNNKITKQLASEEFPNYKKQNMEEQYIVADAMKGWVAYQFRDNYEKKDLLSELIFYGKLMYLAEAMTPESPDSIMMSWSEKELTWAEKHEWNTWKAMANEKVMFQTKAFEINKWFVDGPFTGATGIPQDSPPQLGIWLGWKIVRQYMNANTAVTLQMLVEEKNYQKILSAFKPNR